MASPRAEVVVLIVAWNGRRFLDECLSSLCAAEPVEGDVTVVVVDNGSTDGTAEFVREHFPQVELVTSAENLGYARGNNLGWEWICERRPHTETLVLLNQDTAVDAGWLPPLVRFLEAHPQVAAVQPKLLLHPGSDGPLHSGAAAGPRINTAGNRSHFLGFGYMTGYGEPDDGRFDEPRRIDYGSGAALALRASAFRQSGLFDDGFGMYLEDMELGWRLRLCGLETWYLPESVVCHRHVWQAPYRHYASLEANRFRLLATHLRVRTLLLLAPALALMELGQAWFAARNGLWRDWAAARGRLLSRRWWRAADERRRFVQGMRAASDRDLMADFSGRVDFARLDSPLLRQVANPLLDAYWRVVRRLLR